MTFNKKTARTALGIFSVFAFSFGFFACGKPVTSALVLQNDATADNLIALNACAKTAAIDNPQKSTYMYFAFNAGQDFDRTGKSLEILVSELPKAEIPNAAQPGQNAQTGEQNAPRFCFGWLYEEDFAETYKLNKTLGAHNFVSGSHFPKFRVAMAFPQNVPVRGFFIYADTPVKIESARIVLQKTGWCTAGINAGENSSDPNALVPWYGFESDGGIIKSKYNSLAVDMNPAKKLSLYLGTPAPNESGKYDSIRMNVAGTPLSILQSPNQQKITLYPALLARNAGEDGAVTAEISDLTQTAVTGMVYEPVLPSKVATPLAPIVTDPGLIPNWPKSAWRRDDFELFQWEQFPYVLFFDTKDYDVQDKLFKRLAFFSEKAGYTGKLVTDKVMAGEHGFNAHDYKAQTLADFFELARKTNFPLNEYEVMLQKILCAHGIIAQNADGSFSAGFGALVSISQELSSFLRWRLLAHEGLHCLYFTNANFRSTVANAFNKTDPKSLQFILKYFTVTPSLNYDINDTYLIQNEYMAYILQQPLNEVADYFTKIVATKHYINANCPDLVKYVQESNGWGFYTAAKMMTPFLTDNWNYTAGRIWLVTTDY